EDAVQRRRAGELDVAFLGELARERGDQRLARLDAAAGQVPAAHISVLDQEDAALLVDDDAADAERETAREAPVQMEDAPECGVDDLAHAFHRDARRPCAMTMRASASLTHLRTSHGCVVAIGFVITESCVI